MTFLSSAEFKSLAKNNQLSSLKLPAIVRKQYRATTNTEVGDRCIAFVISSEAVDRDSDIVKQDGWLLDNYMKNPVVLWDHQSGSLPVAKCVQIAVEGNELIATAKFATAEMNPMAEQVYQLLQSRFLNAVSVGFRALAYDFPDDRPDGVDFTQCELMEFSVVSVPSNPEALMIEPVVSAPASPEPVQQDQILNTLNTSSHIRMRLVTRLLGLQNTF